VSQVDGQAVHTPKEFRAAVAGKAGPVDLRLAGEEQQTLRRVAPQAQKAPGP
jgi:hypothetical protein